MRFFTSDIHFNADKAIKMDQRPFKGKEEFDKFIVDLWNKQAKKGDTIYVVGDLIDCKGADDNSWQESILYVKKIKADIVLITGNNEDRVVKYYFNGSFEKFKEYCISIGYKDVCQNLTIDFDGTNLYLIHKPKHHKEGMLNIFGHVHRSGGLYKPYGVNVGCDLNHFRLYDEDGIRHLLDMKKKYWDIDDNLNER